MQPNDIAKRKLKFKMIMPAIIIPFLALLFYSLGGGKNDKQNQQQQTVKGLNPTVPSPSLDEKNPKDKMSIYQQAENERLAKERSSQYDPFAAWMPKPDSNEIPAAAKPEIAVEKKLNELQQLVNTKEPEDNVTRGSPYSRNHNQQISNLETLIHNYQQRAPEEQNAELTRMDSMLEKILDIQHPDRVRDKIALPFDHNKDKPNTITLTKRDSEPTNTFFELENEFELNTASTTIQAVVDKDQIIVSGSTATFRLSQDCYISNTMIPTGSLVYGECTLNSERLNCTIKSIQYRNNNYPVSLSVIDSKDGIAGIYIPGAITREVAKQGSNDAIQNLELATLDQGIGAQATSAAIETAKKLITRKTRLIKATLKSRAPSSINQQQKQLNMQKMLTILFISIFHLFSAHAQINFSRACRAILFTCRRQQNNYTYFTGQH